MRCQCKAGAICVPGPKWLAAGARRAHTGGWDLLLPIPASLISLYTQHVHSYALHRRAVHETLTPPSQLMQKLIAVESVGSQDGRLEGASSRLAKNVGTQRMCVAAHRFPEES